IVSHTSLVSECRAPHSSSSIRHRLVLAQRRWDERSSSSSSSSSVLTSSNESLVFALPPPSGSSSRTFCRPLSRQLTPALVLRSQPKNSTSPTTWHPEYISVGLSIGSTFWSHSCGAPYFA